MPMSILEGVNIVLSNIGHPPVTALDPNGSAGSSLHAQAQYVLEQQTKIVLSEGGHACNFVECKKYTLGTTGQITLASTVLRIKPAGPNQRRNWVQRGSVVWDAERDTDQFPAGDYFFDVSVALTFDQVEYGTQNLIANAAASAFQRQFLNNAQRDAQISEQRARAELQAPRVPMPPPNAQQNARPIIPSSSAQ